MIYDIPTGKNNILNGVNIGAMVSQQWVFFYFQENFLGH